MRLGKRTARLVREASVMAFVQGSMWGRVQGRKGPDDEESTFPRDSEILDRTMRGARSNADLYPTLSKVEYEPLPRPDLLKAILDQRDASSGVSLEGGNP